MAISLTKVDHGTDIPPTRIPLYGLTFTGLSSLGYKQSVCLFPLGHSLAESDRLSRLSSAFCVRV